MLNSHDVVERDLVAVGGGSAMKVLIRCVAAVVLFGACMLYGGAPSTVVGNAPFELRAIPSSAVHHLQAPRIRNENGTSSNWSGYAIETNLAGRPSEAARINNGSVTIVNGSWTVPSVSGGGTTSTYSSTWIGIDGYSGNTVEQIGTEQDWTPAGTVYYAWFEMYPKKAYEIREFPVVPGDVISAQVQYVAKGTFQLTISNDTKGVSYSVTQKLPSAKRQSAEWIMEAPWMGGVLPLADFGDVTFTDCSATLNGHTGTISDPAWQEDPMTMMTADGVVKADPSALSPDGSAFTVTWSHE